MKKTSTKQSVISRAMTCGALLILAGGATAAIAGPALFAAQPVSATTSSNPVADSTSDRSITITKYQAVDANDHGAAGDGTLNTSGLSVTNTPLSGVQFTIQKVIPSDPLTTQLTDPTVQKLGTDYSIDQTFNNNTGKMVGTTNSSGQIVFDLGTGTANDGIYLVTETDDSGAKDTNGKAVTVKQPANPFFVYVPQTTRGTNAGSGLIYNVQAQPKNIVANDLNPVKTIDGMKTESLVAGSNFEWELTTGIPTGLYTTAKTATQLPIVDAQGNQLYTDTAGKVPAYYPIAAGSPIYYDASQDSNTYYNASGVATKAATVSNYSVTDTLNSQLNYKSATVGIATTSGTNGWVQLADADYTVNYDTTTHQFTASLTAQGIKEIGSGTATAKDGSTITIGANSVISTHIQTTVGQNWDGAIPNNFTVTYQTPGSKPLSQTPPTNTQPVYFDGGFDILKEDAANKAKLAGAVFLISDSQDDAAKGMFYATDGKLYQYDNSKPATQNSDGTGTDNSGVLPSGVKWLMSTSDSNGHAAFDGLPLTFADGNSNGVLDLDSNNLPTNGDTVQKTYWVVETQAPKGYELLKTPQSVNVTLSTSPDSTVEVTVDDKATTNLPFTGGMGTGILVTVAIGAIGIGTAFVVVDKKRKANQA